MMDNIITTKLATLKKVKFYKIDPMDIIHDKEYDHLHHKHKELLVYDFRPETWGSKRDLSDIFTIGYAELWEIQDLNALNAPDNEEVTEPVISQVENVDDEDEDDDRSIRCELRLFSNSGEQWGICKYRQLKYKGINIKSVRHKDYLYSIARLIPQYYLIILSYQNEDGNNRSNLAMGMRMNDFYDDLRLQSNLFDYLERKEKLKNFQANFLKDSIGMDKRDSSGSFDIDNEDNDKFAVLDDGDQSENDMHAERFDIDDEDGGSDDSEFGEFLSA